MTLNELTASALMQWTLAVFLLLLEASFIVLIWLGARRSAAGAQRWAGINLEKVISEQDGSASFSRFQFLVFTFIVASAYIVQAFARVAQGSDLPTIPDGVLGLIGISGGSYLVAKGIEASGERDASGAGATGDRWVR